MSTEGSTATAAAQQSSDTDGGTSRHKIHPSVSAPQRVESAAAQKVRTRDSLRGVKTPSQTRIAPLPLGRQRSNNSPPNRHVLTHTRYPRTFATRAMLHFAAAGRVTTPAAGTGQTGKPPVRAGEEAAPSASPADRPLRDSGAAATKAMAGGGYTNGRGSDKQEPAELEAGMREVGERRVTGEGGGSRMGQKGGKGKARGADKDDRWRGRCVWSFCVWWDLVGGRWSLGWENAVLPAAGGRAQKSIWWGVVAAARRPAEPRERRDWWTSPRVPAAGGCRVWLPPPPPPKRRPSIS